MQDMAQLEHWLSFEHLDMWLLLYYFAVGILMLGLWLCIRRFYVVVQAFVLAAVAPLFFLFVDVEQAMPYPFWVDAIVAVLAGDIGQAKQVFVNASQQFQLPYLLYFLAIFVVLFFLGSVISTKTSRR